MAADQDVRDIIGRVGGLTEEKAAEVAAALALAGCVPEGFAPPALYRATIENSTEGYCTGAGRELAGDLATLCRKVDEAAASYYARVERAYDRHGDHRAVCPQFAGGYPSRAPDAGDVVRTRVISLALVAGPDVTALPHDDPRIRLLNRIAGGGVDIPAELARLADEASRGPGPRR